MCVCVCSCAHACRVCFEKDLWKIHTSSLSDSGKKPVLWALLFRWRGCKWRLGERKGLTAGKGRGVQNMCVCGQTQMIGEKSQQGEIKSFIMLISLISGNYRKLKCFGVRSESGQVWSYFLHFLHICGNHGISPLIFMGRERRSWEDAKCSSVAVSNTEKIVVHKYCRILNYEVAVILYKYNKCI